MVSLFFSISNKKSSKIGSTVLALITPLICCKCLSKAEDETINFMNRDFGDETNDFFLQGGFNYDRVNILIITCALRFIFGIMRGSDTAYRQGRVSREKALEKLKHFCGYQERSHAEVKQKLYALGLFKNEVEEIITCLIEESYLNEQRYATQFASGKLRIKGWGRQKIYHELRQKQISEFCIKKALAELDEAEYLKVFARLAEKKWNLLHGEKNIFVRKNKCRQYLLQRGFETALINRFDFLKE
jgi:regulatory protein